MFANNYRLVLKVTLLKSALIILLNSGVFWALNSLGGWTQADIGNAPQPAYFILCLIGVSVGTFSIFHSCLTQKAEHEAKAFHHLLQHLQGVAGGLCVLLSLMGLVQI